MVEAHDRYSSMDVAEFGEVQIYGTLASGCGAVGSFKKMVAAVWGGITDEGGFGIVFS